MKFIQILISIICLLWLSGCMMTSADKVKLHPNSTPYVMELSNMDRIVLESSKVPARNPDGTVVKDSSGNVVMEVPEKETTTINSDGSKTTTKERQLASVKIKDQTMKAPMTGIDLASQLLSYTPMGLMGFTAYKLGVKGIDSASKDPLVVEKNTTTPLVISGEETEVVYPKE